MAVGKDKNKRRKRRVPVPQKPPKIIEDKKVYNRKKQKDENIKKKNREE